MLVILTLSTKGSAIPVAVLQQVDSAMEAAGLRRQVRSVLVPGRQFSVTYEAPTIERSKVEEIIAPIAERNQIIVSVEVEESVSFP
jgi:hypothetical protein